MTDLTDSLERKASASALKVMYLCGPQGGVRLHFTIKKVEQASFMFHVCVSINVGDSISHEEGQGHYCTLALVA